ncbi:hypothetical protein FDECE_8423 [Fusarium decemcellulare]|nr:hypothetical protein FDECE_8423 [Fusarium decemcellulare]
MVTGSSHFDDVEISIGSTLPDEFRNEDEVIGYVEPWIASPGEEISVKVSSTIPKYTWSLVRLIQGLDHPKAPAVKEEVISVPSSGHDVINGGYKKAHCGSYALIESWKNTQRSQIKGLRFTCFVQPWLLDTDQDQVLMSTLDASQALGIALLLRKPGQLCIYVGNGQSIDSYDTGIDLRRWRWAEVDLQIDSDGLALQVNHRQRLVEVTPGPSAFSKKLDRLPVLNGSQSLLLAAGCFSNELLPADSPSCIFNGRLDSPHLQISFDGSSFTTWARYDFSLDIPTDRITDTSLNANHGILVNAPTRAIKGHDWDGSESDWTKAKYGYGAIHFHEDDLDDASWSTDFTIKIPIDVPSGAYAVAVKGVDREDVVDKITFFVRPHHDSCTPHPRVAMVLSTFTYLAYANEHMFDESRDSKMVLAGGVHIRKDADWRRVVRRSDLGCSLYDVHRDGSGNVFTSSKRPILNIRPGYVNWAFHRPREFSADQFMIGLLEERLGRRGYDVLTDHDLHLRGVNALQGYDVVLTGCHPEYPSLESLNAYAAFAKRGGNIMYLGGNGFYWCSVTDPSRPHRMEVRRGDQGCRSFGLPAGERMHSLNGAQGGLWRGRGRNPQSLFGIGSCACGNGPGVPYQFSNDIVRSSDFAWLFEGLERDDNEGIPLLGIEGFGGGASGDEIDRLDFGLGTPANAVLLATSTGHDDSFGLFNEESMYPMVNTTGTNCDKIRSDMVIYETNEGGSVFSVGSINWYCSLGWNKYENNVARLTWNVVKEFLKRSQSRDSVV